ncbi:hypothetical protein ACJIZ3_005485 [Penstemon smallii]|uniref:Uncharacterized protein n=1 Tax=Penstemon smallii TaxID=265156 RepID=A0ABD3S597_9LAMI
MYKKYPLYIRSVTCIVMKRCVFVFNYKS